MCPIGLPDLVFAPGLISKPLHRWTDLLVGRRWLLSFCSALNCVAVSLSTWSTSPLRRAATAASVFLKYCRMRVSYSGAPRKKSLLRLSVAYWSVL